MFLVFLVRFHSNMDCSNSDSNTTNPFLCLPSYDQLSSSSSLTKLRLSWLVSLSLRNVCLMASSSVSSMRTFSRWKARRFWICLMGNGFMSIKAILISFLGRKRKRFWTFNLHSSAQSPTGMFPYLQSRIVRVKYRRYLKRVVESCSFKNSSSLYLKSERAKRNMICAENGKHVNECSQTDRTDTPNKEL